MDRYDEQGRFIASKNNLPHGAQEVLADWIAAFGRECAAQAYEDAAKYAREIGGITATDKIDRKEIGKTKAAEFLANRYDEHAAALRPAPSSEAK
jgi:hypothetical protein